MGLRLHVAREHVEQGAEGEIARENVRLQKLAMILVLFGVIVLS